MYWKFAYTEIIDDATRAVPPQISNYAQGILDCGKSINLLKICCPNLFGLKFLYYKPPPPLSMVFSLPAISSKLKESLEYIILLQKAEELYAMKPEKMSIDSFYIECQKYVNRKAMLEMVQRRWNFLCVSAYINSNIRCSSQVNQYLKNKNVLPVSTKAKFCKTTSRSLNSLTVDNIYQNCKLCGELFGNIGLIFSSCGYHFRDLQNDVEDIRADFTSPSFHQQLELISYSQVCVEHPISLNRYKKFLSLPEIDFLNSLQVDLFSRLDASNVNFMQSNYLPAPLKCSPNHTISREVGKGKNLTTSGLERSPNGARSFVENLASLLISEYGDSIDDVYNCIQVTSLQRLMMHNFDAVLKMRIHLVERTIMQYIVKELGLDSLLRNLRNLYFLQDETFSHSFCEQLFPFVMKCQTPRAFANWAILNEMLQLAIANCNRENDTFFSSVNVNVLFVPDDIPSERTAFLRLLTIEREVEWPLNLIVHPTCIQQYLKIFSTLLEIEFLCWLLSCIWRTLIVTSKELHLDDTPQFRKIMLNRFEMEQFIRIIRNSIHQHLQGPLWEFLQKSLSGEESSIDGLESIHMQYLEKALARCFLTDETHVLHELLTVMLCQIYKFSSTVFECRWEKSTKTGYHEVYEYNRLLSYFNTFKQYQKVFLKRILKETLTKKFGRHWDKDYQDFLDTILETEKNVP